MMNGNGKAFLGISLVFILGLVAGVLVSSIYFHHRTTVFFQRGAAAYVDVLEKRMTHNLDLNAEQKQKVHALFLQNLEERKKLQGQIQPEIQLLNLRTFQQVNTVLNPTQTRQLRENLMQFRKRLGRPLLEPPATGSPSPAPVDAPSTATPGI